ncbi:MAG: acetyl-CoA carboxylase, carboxyltransferase subunit beta [Bryobacterales bacterium]|nr:acetyl-CoA carboxylase, carboxyltransferase subunit beta [Bryobacterales bacterium]
MPWFRRENEPKRVHTEGLWIKCDECAAPIWKKDLEADGMVCGKCGFHFKITANQRLAMLFDESRWDDVGGNLSSTNALQFADRKSYSERLADAKEKTGLDDAVICGRGRLNGRDIVICAMEYRFIGGSMGAVVGEKLTRAAELSASAGVPLVIVSASGGARMMEGMVSLVQMAKVSAALKKLDQAKVPYISVLTDPTTGGVTASFAMLGDLNIAEPGALIGFAGPRVIEQTIRQKLPKGFQRAEFLLKHGMLDAVVPRPEMKQYLGNALEFFGGPAS